MRKLFLQATLLAVFLLTDGKDAPQNSTDDDPSRQTKQAEKEKRIFVGISTSTVTSTIVTYTTILMPLVCRILPKKRRDLGEFLALQHIKHSPKKNFSIETEAEVQEPELHSSNNDANMEPSDLSGSESDAASKTDKGYIINKLVRVWETVSTVVTLTVVSTNPTLLMPAADFLNNLPFNICPLI